MALGNVFLWSGAVFYPYYVHSDALRHISPLADQNLAGAVVMVQESILTIGLFCWLFACTARETKERRDPLVFAQARRGRADRRPRRARGSDGRTKRGAAQAPGEQRRRTGTSGSLRSDILRICALVV